MRMPLLRIAATAVLLTLAAPIAATADDGPPEFGNLLSPDEGNLLAEQAGNLLGDEAGNLLGEHVGGPWDEASEAVGALDDEAVAVVRTVRAVIWP